jgi:Domain of unknown function (DUF4198)
VEGSVTSWTRRARQGLVVAFIVLAVSVGSLAAHDLFLKPDSFFVAQGASVTVRALNGTFSKSENAIARDRLLDISLVGPAGRSRIDTAAWGDRGDTSILIVKSAESGTYLIGASLKPRELTQAAKDFNTYLASDGVADVLAQRRRDGELERPARERYSKHVKALVQVGPTRSQSFGETLGYAAELIPLDNPYVLKSGGTLRVKTLVDGTPVKNQLVISGGRTATGQRIGQRSVRSDSSGIARVLITQPGVWYVKFIHMQRSTADTTIDYESKWATLTFALR